MEVRAWLNSVQMLVCIRYNSVCYHIHKLYHIATNICTDQNTGVSPDSLPITYYSNETQFHYLKCLTMHDAEHLMLPVPDFNQGSNLKAKFNIN